MVFSAGEGQSENDLNKVVESERERKLKKKSAEEAKEKIRRNNPNEKLLYSMNENENQNGSSRDRRESRDKKLFQNEKVNEINNLHISYFFFTIFKGWSGENY